MHSRYRVIGRRAYRGYNHGEEFEANLDERAEQRAVDRGDIEVVERIRMKLPSRRRLPDDWPPRADSTSKQEAPQGASPM